MKMILAQILLNNSIKTNVHRELNLWVFVEIGIVDSYLLICHYYSLPEIIRMIGVKELSLRCQEFKVCHICSFPLLSPLQCV